MNTQFTPHLEILPLPQRLLWNEFHAMPGEFILYGGTAIALHLGHRQSVDFDFFGEQYFNPDRLVALLPFLHDAKIVQKEANTLSVIVERAGEVRLSFFGLPGLAKLFAPHCSPDHGLKVASLVDLAGMKAAVVQKRAEAKDYMDMDAILVHGTVNMATALAAARAIYGQSFNPLITLKALSYFDDGNLKHLPEDLKRRLVKAVTAVDPDRLPILALRTGQACGRGWRYDG